MIDKYLLHLKTCICIYVIILLMAFPNLSEEQLRLCFNPDLTSCDSNDIFQCGKCKHQFNNLQKFLQHKSTSCGSNEDVTQYKVFIVNNSGNEQVSILPEDNFEPPLTQICTAEMNQFDGVNGCSVSEISGTYFSETSLDSLAITSTKRILLNDSVFIDNQENMKLFADYDDAKLDCNPNENNLFLSMLNDVTEHNPSENIFQLETSSNFFDHTISTSKLSSSETILNKEQHEIIAKSNITSVMEKSPHICFDERSKSGFVDTCPTSEPIVSEKSSVIQRSKYSCRYCGKAFKKNFDVLQHERSHTGEKPFQCIVCGRAFAQKSNVKKHMASHKVWLKKNVKFNQSFAKDEITPMKDCVLNNADLLPFVCQYCGEGFPTYLKRKTHMKLHKDQQAYKCLKEGCSSTFQDLDQFVAHVKSHDCGMTYRCHQCHKVFKSLHDLGVHQYQVHLTNRKKISQTKLYACSLCPSKFTHPTALHEHMASDVHSYICRFCDAKFSCERYLRRHYTLQHKKKDKIECDICGKQLASIYYLKQHKLIHTKELPFKCKKCDAAFNRKDKLKRHMLAQHPKT